jgi:hypothetical protein
LIVHVAQSCRHSSPSSEGFVFEKSVSAVGAFEKSSELSIAGLGFDVVEGEGEGEGEKSDAPRRRNVCIVIYTFFLFVLRCGPVSGSERGS